MPSAGLCPKQRLIQRFPRIRIVKRHVVPQPLHPQDTALDPDTLIAIFIAHPAQCPGLVLSVDPIADQQLFQ